MVLVIRRDKAFGEHNKFSCKYVNTLKRNLKCSPSEERLRRSVKLFSWSVAFYTELTAAVALHVVQISLELEIRLHIVVWV